MLSDLVRVAAYVVAAVNGASGLYGALRYGRRETSRAFWIGARTGQAGAGALALLALALWVGNRRAGADLFYLYALLAPAIGLIAEQLRIASAEQVLENNDLADAAAVGRLPAAEQRSIVAAILLREMGVMASAALVVCFLALRAAATAAGI